MHLPSKNSYLVDAHVHLHPCYNAEQFLNAARQNFQHRVNQLNIVSPFLGVLMLTEIANVHAFSSLAEQVNQSIGDWTVTKTAESISLKLTHPSGDVLLLIAGRQIVTQEKVEVLALATNAEIKDGLSLDETLDSAIALDSIPVLPWGVGKWIGDRGRLVQAALKTRPVFAGDNGGRPGFWPLPKFAQVRSLPGTDPLPLSSDVSRAGSFGFVVRGAFDKAKPGASLKHYLQNLRSENSTIEAYGRSQSPWTFVKNQTLLRLA